MKKKLFSLLLVLIFLTATVTSASAQSYSFEVPTQEVEVFLQQDGTAVINYTIDFKNASGAPAIEYVDIGMPNSNYEIGSITADVNGQAITDIQESTFVTPGVALGLGGNAIQPGATGKVQARIGLVRDVLFPGTAKESEKYASFQFSPSWFDASSVIGKTDMRVTLILPPGVKSEEPRYFPPKSWPGDSAPETGLDNQNRVFYSWHSTQATAHTQYIFGASFPARLVPDTAISTPPVTKSVSFNSETLCCWGFGLFFTGFFVFIIYAATVGANKRKLAYLPPKISIEGHGIKRGLTAIEAAILMEESLDKIFTMILFSVLKKSAATVTKRDPLVIEPVSPQPEGLQTYETDFLKAFAETDKVKRRTALQDMVIALVQSVAEKMKGFSRKETVAYYKDIIKRAWEQVEQAQTPEVKSEKYDQYMGWTMLDKDYDDHTRRSFGSGPVFLPNWWWRYDPTYTATSFGGGHNASPTSASGGSTTTVSLPNMPGSSFAASIVGGVQSFSSGVVGSISDFTNGITNKTNPVPKTTSSGYKGSSGGHCNCACACACAGCACACAGGGR